MALAVHLVAGVLGLVCPDDGQHAVPLQELTARIVAVWQGWGEVYWQVK